MPWNSLILGILLAGIAWSMFWPEREVVGKEKEVVEKTSRSRERRIEWSHLDSADLSERYRIWRDLEKVPVRELQGALDRELAEVGKGKLSNPMKLLLIEWSRREPLSTMEWAWEHLRESRNWPNAYAQIGSQWAGDDPPGFSEFLIRHRQSATDSRFGARTISIESLLASEKIIVGEGEGKKGVNWLMKSAPREAFTVYRKFSSSYDGEFRELVGLLDSGADLASALSAWDDYDPEKEAQALRELKKFEKKFRDVPNTYTEKTLRLWTQEFRYENLKHPSKSKLVQVLIARWRKVDPEGFEKSPYVEWVE